MGVLDYCFSGLLLDFFLQERHVEPVLIRLWKISCHLYTLESVVFDEAQASPDVA